MENKLARIAAVLTVAWLMAAGPVAYAEFGENDPSGGKSGKSGGGGKGIMDELNLTPEQRTQFMEVDTPAKRERAQEVREQLPIKTQALEAMLTEEGSTRADVNDLMEEVNTLQAEMLSQRIDRYFSMKEILTPEQFAKMQEIEAAQGGQVSEGQMEKSQEPGQEGSGEENQEPGQEGSGEENQESDQAYS